jgi:hypothetical protein
MIPKLGACHSSIESVDFMSDRLPVAHVIALDRKSGLKVDGAGLDERA